MNWKNITVPVSSAVISSLRSSDQLLLSGTIFTARDKAHQRIQDIVREGGNLPFDLKGITIYYSGPSPTPPGGITGSAGPTTSSRLDPYTEMMMELGVNCFIGKGGRSGAVRQAFMKYGAVYLASFGGAGAYLSKRIVRSSVIAFGDLGPEAVFELEVKDFPAIVINDTRGGDLYESAVQI
jgi:fumarate hydratase subunit beta